MIVITAASGNLGRATAKALQTKVDPKNIRLAARSTGKLADLAGQGFEVVQADYDNAASLRTAFTGADSVLIISSMGPNEVRAAHHNLEANGVANVAMVRMAAEEISDALAKVRPFTRLKDVALDDYRFTTLFVDPPRAGLDPATLALAGGFERILYISCNPQTLCENVAELAATHEISAAAVFDQFPWTHHLECGLLLSRKA